MYCYLLHLVFQEYDPLDATVVEDFEAYVPSAVVSRNVTLDVRSQICSLFFRHQTVAGESQRFCLGHTRLT